MEDDDKYSRAEHWLGTPAVHGARVGPFELRLAPTAPDGGLGVEYYDVFLESLDTPLFARVSAAAADVATREFLARMVECLPKTNPAPIASETSSAPPASARALRRRRSNAKKRRSKVPRPSVTQVLGLACVVALTSLCSYYFGTTQSPAVESGVVEP
ncbi:MAG: hypothetical protein ABIQ16_11825 [Polyangiaceae bacterium]